MSLPSLTRTISFVRDADQAAYAPPPNLAAREGEAASSREAPPVVGAVPFPGSVLQRAGPDPIRWGGPRLAWENRANPEAPSVFILDDVKEQDFWDRAGVVRQKFTRTVSSALSAMNANLG